MVRGTPVVGSPMLLRRQDVVIAFQVVSMQAPSAVGCGDAAPEQPGGGVAARAKGMGHNLAGSAAQRQPHPDHPPAAMPDKAPQFVHFQRILRLGRGQGSLQGGQAQRFFLSQPLTVLRATPKVRLKPRRLLRSS